MSFNLPKEATGWKNYEGYNPSGDIQKQMLDGIGDAVGEGLTALYTASGYLNWVKTAQYPSFWGPIHGLADVEHMLNATYHAYMQARFLPPRTKQIAAENISKAMLWVREQRAWQASRTGGTPVAF
ncbi:hypothetical protein ACFWUQ_27105 [Streptomyces sp. NPDC058662]|uniref:hypothetical protein n=1 Tax=Streptomyces sp. NPDC058662 TaxID=3346583 RepID=UPI003647979E